MIITIDQASYHNYSEPKLFNPTPPRYDCDFGYPPNTSRAMVLQTLRQNETPNLYNPYVLQPLTPHTPRTPKQ